MNDASLTELERTQGEANMKFAEATAAKEAAADNLAAAEQAYYDALENYTFGDAPEENYDKKEAAKEAVEKAMSAAKKLYEKGSSVEDISEVLDIPVEKIIIPANKTPLAVMRINDPPFDSLVVSIISVSFHFITVQLHNKREVINPHCLIAALIFRY